LDSKQFSWGDSVKAALMAGARTMYNYLGLCRLVISGRIVLALPGFQRIRSPPVTTNFSHRVGISTILLRISSSVILSHSSKITCFSSSNVRQFPYRFLTRCFRIFQTPSTGFRSGDCAGCRRVSIKLASFSFRATLFADLVPCDESLSSWRIQSQVRRKAAPSKHSTSTTSISLLQPKPHHLKPNLAWWQHHIADSKIFRRKAPHWGQCDTILSPTEQATPWYTDSISVILRGLFC